MSQKQHFEKIETSGGLEGEILIEAVLRDPDGEPAVLFFNGKDFLFALPLALARTMHAALGRQIERAEKIAKEHAQTVRRASKAQSN